MVPNKILNSKKPNHSKIRPRQGRVLYLSLLFQRAKYPTFCDIESNQLFEYNISLLVYSKSIIQQQQQYFFYQYDIISYCEVVFGREYGAEVPHQVALNYLLFRTSSGLNYQFITLFIIQSSNVLNSILYIVYAGSVCHTYIVTLIYIVIYLFFELKLLVRSMIFSFEIIS